MRSLPLWTSCLAGVLRLAAHATRSRQLVVARHSRAEARAVSPSVMARRCSAAGAPDNEQYAVKVVRLRKYEDRALVAHERRALELLRGAARVVQLRRAYLAAGRAHLVFECAPAALVPGMGEVSQHHLTVSA